jgi:hypothetical protein
LPEHPLKAGVGIYLAYTPIEIEGAKIRGAETYSISLQTTESIGALIARYLYEKDEVHVIYGDEYTRVEFAAASHYHNDICPNSDLGTRNDADGNKRQ